MKTNTPIEDRLAELAEQLRARPSLVSRVMERVTPLPTQPTPPKLPKRLRKWMMGTTSRYAAGGIIATTLVLAMIFCTRLTEFGASLAFADVQEALRQVTTAVVEIEMPGHPSSNQKIYLARDRNFYRVESTGGGFSFLLDCNQGKALVLNHERKTAQMQTDSIWRSDYAAAANGMLDEMANIDQGAVERLGSREFEGQTLVGFRLGGNINDGRMKRLVWVDPKTRLPMRGEVLPLDPKDPEAAMIAMRLRYTLNVPLDESLFSLTIPEGYKVVEDRILTKEDRVTPSSEDPAVAAPVIEPLMGIGRARFGMTVDQVIEVLGEPSRTNRYWNEPLERKREVERVCKEAKEQNCDEAELLRRVKKVLEMNRIDTDRQPADGVDLAYKERGFMLKVGDDDGLRAVNCVSDWPDMRDFAGKTPKGIGIGSTREEVERAYGPAIVPPRGPADYKFKNCFRLEYPLLGVSMVLKNGRVQHITLVSKAVATQRKAEAETD